MLPEIRKELTLADRWILSRLGKAALAVLPEGVWLRAGADLWIASDGRALMLARVAQTLYWTARDLERGERLGEEDDGEKGSLAHRAEPSSGRAHGRFFRRCKRVSRTPQDRARHRWGNDPIP